MNFVKYSFKPFPNLTNVPQVILQSTAHTLYVDSITICNLSTNDIRINLIKKIIGSDSSVNQTFIAKNIVVESPTSAKIEVRSTVNLVSLFGLTMFLPIFTENAITYTTELICYSNGITQNFDCTVDYTTFVETPVI